MFFHKRSRLLIVVPVIPYVGAILGDRHAHANVYANERKIKEQTGNIYVKSARKAEVQTF